MRCCENMDEFGDWTPIGRFGLQSLESGAEAIDASRVILEDVRAWEARRSAESSEWGLVVLTSGEAFERRGLLSRLTFNGLGRESEWALTSHTHPRGFPPSIDDLQFLFTHSAGIRMRVAVAGRPSVELWRTKKRVLTNADVSAIFYQVRRRAYRASPPDADEACISRCIWAELQKECDNLGIEWTQDLRTDI